MFLLSAECFHPSLVHLVNRMLLEVVFDESIGLVGVCVFVVAHVDVMMAYHLFGGDVPSSVRAKPGWSSTIIPHIPHLFIIIGVFAWQPHIIGVFASGWISVERCFILCVSKEQHVAIDRNFSDISFGDVLVGNGFLRGVAVDSFGFGDVILEGALWCFAFLDEGTTIKMRSSVQPCLKKRPKLKASWPCKGFTSSLKRFINPFQRLIRGRASSRALHRAL